MGIINSTTTFISYWYFRYLMVTELYMVEKWERAVINVVMLVVFCILSYFNYAVLLHATSSALKYIHLLSGS